MHELGLCEGVMDAVERRADGRRLTRVTIRVGVLHRVCGDALQQAFELLSLGTAAQGAVLDVVTVAVSVDCRACGAHTEADELTPVCPACGAQDTTLSGGDELLLESVDLAVPAAQQA